MTVESRAGRFHYGFVIAFLAGLSMFASFGLGRFTYGILLPSMKTSLNLSYTEGSLLASANLGAYIAGAPIAGMLTARLGARRVIAIGLGILAVALFVLSRAPGFPAAFLSLALIGFGAGLGVVPALGSVAAWFAPRQRGLGMGLALALPAVSYVLTGLIVPRLIAADPEAGWRRTWLLTAVATLAIGGAILAFFRNRPAEVGLTPIGGANPPVQATNPGVRALLRIVSLRFLAAAYACFGFSYAVFATFYPAFLEREIHYTPEEVGRYWMAIGLSALVGPVAFGWLSDRIGRRSGLSLMLFLQAAAISSLVLLPIAMGGWVAAIGYGLTLFSIVAVVAAAGGDYVDSTLASAAIGLATMIMGFGQTSGPLLTGPLIDLTGTFIPVFIVAAAVSVLGGTLALFLPKRRDRSDVPPVTRDRLAIGR